MIVVPLHSTVVLLKGEFFITTDGFVRGFTFYCSSIKGYDIGVQEIAFDRLYILL